ncbi:MULTISPECIES: HalOD1 output domain-containing protein [unclassified Haladaptatus]|uniref:HalOD1 output domain-containing protein n=1 Tax=unclassified Haladaptatus TaxID=2622732 RepID=UPI00209C0052|nr:MULTISPECIES: HalOD1 output domain-containing protein [unclassified Haladaptatus]MCO8245558.1 hypothetical protein [Haladaptatus sp. AB643]MCO8255385.1 hypothetical protein [Haladaptatus sp. AB618]
MSKSENHSCPTETITATYHTRHDWQDAEPLSTTVTTALAEAMDADPTEIGPLYDQFDPDALDGLFHPRPDGVARTGGHVSFTIDGYRVFVRSDGFVSVHPIDGIDGDD